MPVSSGPGLVGRASPDAQLWVAFGLSRNQIGLEEAAVGISDPDSSLFRRYITVEAIRTGYGASPAVQQQALAALEQAGFDGKVDATGGLLIGKMSVADAQSLFGTAFDVWRLDDGTTVIRPAEALEVPRDLQLQGIDGVAGATATVSSATGDAVTASMTPTPSRSDDPSSADCGGVQPGVPAEVTAARDYYGIASLDTASAATVRVGLLEIAGFTPDSLELWASCRGISHIPEVGVTVVNVAAGSAETAETSLDAIVLTLAAPTLNAITMYEFDTNNSIVFPLAAVLDDADNTNTPLDIVSTSIAYCETGISGSGFDMAEWLLASTVSVGTTVVAAAGDTGSSGCYPPDKSQNVTYPASSQYVTGVGGTQLETDNGTISGEVVWNETGEGQNIAGGGSESSLIIRPGYQANTGIDTKHRQVPDVAYLADPAQVGPIPICGSDGACTWQRVAGTSAAAPGFAGGLAMIIAGRQADGRTARLGNINPLIYKLAGTNAAAITYDITQGNNDIFNVGCCTAKVGYDLASGWGSIRFDQLNQQIP